MTIDLSTCWTEHPVVVIDFETCSLDPSDGAVEVAAARFEGGRVVNQFRSFINPGKPIPEAAQAIHGITDAMVANAPALKDLAQSLFAVCRGAVPCAYSSNFDRAFLHHDITGADCPAFDPSFPGWIDPLVCIKKADRFVSGAGRHKLTSVCERWGIELTTAHRALGDATATGRLLYALLDRGTLKRCPLGKFIEHTERERAEQEADFQAWKARQQKVSANG